MGSNNDNTRKQPRKKSSGYKKLILFVFMLLIVMAMGIGLGFLTATLNTRPTVAADIRPSASSQIYDADGTLITNIHSVENRLPVTIKQIPRNLQNAFVAVEDARFYSHNGVDPRGILRAIWANITNRGVAEGGSTITQQLAKNAYLSQERTLKRKIQEVFLAIQLERQYTKTEILELYMNQIYFGQGAYGVQAAAQIYFGKNVEDLSLPECAMLAGIPKSPNYYSPFNNLKAANERKAIVLDQMKKYGYIDTGTAIKAKNEEIKLAKQNNSESTLASYFINYVLEELVDKYGADVVYKEGLKIYTTIDLDMQRIAEEAMNKLPTYYTDENTIRQPQGALVCIDQTTGHIKAMVGGRGEDQFNRATMAVRQPGSAFKPFVFLAALESNLTPATVIDDSPITIGDWTPENYDRRFNGKVTLRQTAERSLNIPTVKVAQLIGIDKPLYYAQSLGISTLVMEGAYNDRNLSSALGGLTRGVTPLEIASAYGAFANRGVHMNTVAVTKVVDRNGKILEETSPSGLSIINEKSAYVLTDMLRGVIAHGTGTGANIGRPAAGKTGTTSDYKDAWFIGYTPELVTAVWMGIDNEGNLNGITGAGTPAEIWQYFMSRATAGLPVTDFISPAGFVIDPQPSKDVIGEDKSKKDTSDDKSADIKNEKPAVNRDNAKEKPVVAPNDKANGKTSADVPTSLPDAKPKPDVEPKQPDRPQTEPTEPSSIPVAPATPKAGRPSSMGIKN